MIGYQPHFYKWSWESSILWGYLSPREHVYVVFPSALCNVCLAWKEVFKTGKASQEKSVYTKKFLFPISIPSQNYSSKSRRLVYFLIFCRPKRLKVKMKGKCCDCVRWQEVDLIYCFANHLHPLLSDRPLHSTVPDKKRQLVFLLDFIDDHKEQDLANHVIFCMRINSYSLVILSVPCLSRK